MAFQYLGYAPPELADVAVPRSHSAWRFRVARWNSAAEPDAGFIFDNEKWRHSGAVPAFDIDASPVTRSRLRRIRRRGRLPAQGGVVGSRLGLAHGQRSQPPAVLAAGKGRLAGAPLRHWTPLRAGAPMLHVNRYEAEACAAWLGRRLPTAASGSTRRRGRIFNGAGRGSGCAIRSRRIRASSPIPTAIIRSPGSTRMGNCAAAGR